MIIKSTKGAGVDRVKVLIHGPSGIGKTTLAKTISEKTLVVSAESGLMSIRDSDIDYIDITTDDDGNLIPKELRVQKLGDIYKYLLTKEASDKYSVVFVDSLTEIGQNISESLFEKNTDKKDTFKVWGEYTSQMRNLIKAFRDLPKYHVIMTALTKEYTDELKNKRLGIDIQGSIGEQCPALFDEVFHYTQLVNQAGDLERVLLTSLTDRIFAKDRSGSLDKYEKPNLQTIINKIKGVN